MAVNAIPSRPAPTVARPPIFAQWLAEAAVLASGEVCLERIRFARADRGREPADGGFAMKRGIWAGALAEHELVGFATHGQFTINLGELADRLAAKLRLDRQFPPAGWLRCAPS
jgi:hypothetical protein